MTRPLVDVVVPVYRPGHWLAACLSSVTESTGVNVRLFVVDDTPGDPDVTDEVAGLEGAGLIVLDENRGFAAAANRGISAGTAPYVLLLNQDARVEADFLERLSKRLRADLRLAAVSGKVLHQSSPDVSPDGTIDSAGLEFRRGRRAVDIGQGEADDGRYNGYREVFGVCAAVALYRRSALEAVVEPTGVFDETFFMHKEDVDLAWRLRRAGYAAAVDGGAVAYHARGTRRANDLRDGRKLGVLSSLITAELAKNAAVRRLAWRNQLFMIVKNEALGDLRRSIGWIALYQLAYALAGIVLDPAGAVVSRLRFVGDIPSLPERRSRRRSVVPLSQWLP
jgi:GT2 family glycosyltransferase